MEEKLKNYIFENVAKLTDKDREVISSLICEEMNLDRCFEIVKLIISLPAPLACCTTHRRSQKIQNRRSQKILKSY